MKFHKLMSRTVMVTALLGVTVGIGFSSSNVSASRDPNSNIHGFAGNSVNEPGYSDSTNTQADITQGLLTLDSVPDLNFGNNDQNFNSGNNTQLNLSNNEGTSNDGNDKGLLKVTDYRATSQKRYGSWTLSAKLSNFNNVNDSSNFDNNPSAWQMDLKNNSVNYSGNNYNRYFGSDLDNNRQSSSDTNTKPHINDNVSLPSDNSTSKPIMGTNNNYNSGHGVTTMTYDSNSGSILNIPYNVQPGKYNGTVTWSLTANADSSSNDTNGSGSSGNANYNNTSTYSKGSQE